MWKRNQLPHVPTLDHQPTPAPEFRAHGELGGVRGREWWPRRNESFRVLSEGAIEEAESSRVSRSPGWENVLKQILIAALIAFVFEFSAQARPVKLWSPEELYEKADAVIIGVAVEIQKTNQKSTLQSGGHGTIPTISRTAKLRVVYMIKGKIPTEVDFRYRLLDSDTGLENGPERVFLREGETCVFYLVKDSQNENAFVGVLEGEYDDKQAVFRVTPNPFKQRFPRVKTRP